METTISNNDCLSYEQLQAYAVNKNSTTDQALLYKHISTCELCTCAVNGFTVVPFISDDLVAIHCEIDARTNATHLNPLTFAQVFIIIVSLVSIFGFYKFANTISENKIRALPFKNNAFVINPAIKTEGTELTQPKINLKAPTLKHVKKQSPDLPPKVLLPIEHMEAIDVRLKETSVNHQENTMFPFDLSDVIYIENFKIAEYRKLYFKNTTDISDLANNTPPYKENKDADPLVENDYYKRIPAINVLKKGLHYLNKTKYSKAIEQFQLMTENNSEDINALFYSGLAYYHLGKNNPAIQKFESVLQNTNPAFYPEAKWHLALLLIKINKDRSTQLLKEIIDENGFYAKQAKELLKKM